MRLGIISTPRSGNTWLRHLLAAAYQVPTRGFHQITPEDWANLEPELVYQHHWPRTPEYREQLHTHGVQPVVILRHPLDVLISILHVVIYDVQAEHWLLAGPEAGERAIWGAMPRSRPFLNYARSERAASLLQLSLDWWEHPDIVRVRYEDLVANPVGELQRIEDQLQPLFGPFRAPSVADVVGQHTLDAMAKTVVNNHFWKGRPGLWRELLTQREIDELQPALGTLLARGGYTAVPDPTLTADAADANWVRYVGEEIGRTIRQQTEGHYATLRRMQEEAWRNHADAANAWQQWHIMKGHLDAAYQRIAELEAQLGRYDQLRTLIHEFLGTSPTQQRQAA